MGATQFNIIQRIISKASAYSPVTSAWGGEYSDEIVDIAI